MNIYYVLLIILGVSPLIEIVLFLFIKALKWRICILLIPIILTIIYFLFTTPPIEEVVNRDVFLMTYFY